MTQYLSMDLNYWNNNNYFFEKNWCDNLNFTDINFLYAHSSVNENIYFYKHNINPTINTTKQHRYNHNQWGYNSFKGPIVYTIIFFLINLLGVESKTVDLINVMKKMTINTTQQKTFDENNFNNYDLLNKHYIYDNKYKICEYNQWLLKELKIFNQTSKPIIGFIYNNSITGQKNFISSRPNKYNSQFFKDLFDTTKINSIKEFSKTNLDCSQDSSDQYKLCDIIGNRIFFNPQEDTDDQRAFDTMDQHFIEITPFKSIDECINDGVHSNNLNKLSMPLNIENINNNNRYNTITRNKNGNIMGIKGPFNINNQIMYLGRPLDINGNIVGNSIEYYTEIPSYNYNLNKEKLQEYSSMIYNNNTVSWQCQDQITTTSFQDPFDLDNYFLKCRDKLGNTPHIFLIYGNDILYGIKNFITYITNIIPTMNYEYNIINSGYNALNKITINLFNSMSLWAYNFPSLDYNPGKELFAYKESPKDLYITQSIFDLKNKSGKTSHIGQGMLFNIDNWVINNPTVKQNIFNGEFQWLYWSMDNNYNTSSLNLPPLNTETKNFGNIISPDGSTLGTIFSYSQPFLSLDIFANGTVINPLKRVRWEKGFNTGSCIKPSTFCIPQLYTNRGDSLFSLINCIGNFLYRNTNEYDFNNIKGNIYFDQDQKNQLKIFYTMMGKNDKNLWLTTVDDEYSNKFTLQDIITQIPFTQLWDGFVMGKTMDDYNVTFAMDQNFNNLWLYNNNTGFKSNQGKYKITDINPPMMESIFNYNFLHNLLYNVQYLSGVRYTNINLKDLLLEPFYINTINLYNKKNNRWKILEWVNNNLIACNNKCYKLNYNGMVKEPYEGAPNITNPYNNNFTFWDIDGSGSWNYYDDNNKLYNCDTIFFNGTQWDNESILCSKTSYDLNNFLFIYKKKTNSVIYPLILNNFNKYYIFNTTDGNNIYFNPENSYGFSNIYHQKIKPMFFNVFNSNSIDIYDNNLKILKTFSTLWMEYKMPHHIQFNNEFSWQKYFITKSKDVVKGLGNITDGSTKICSKDKNQQFWCVNGDPQGFIMYYNQNKPLKATPINGFETINVPYSQWKNKKFSKTSIMYDFNLPPIVDTFNTNYLPLECRTITDQWFDNIDIVLPIGNFCQYGSSKFIELLSAPQWNMKLKKKVKNIVGWFVCEGNQDCNFKLLNNSQVNCSPNQCKIDNYILNNNYLDRLMDDNLIKSINRQFNLSTQYLIGLFPQNQYFFGNFMNKEIVGSVILDFNIPQWDRYLQWMEYRWIGHFINIGFISILSIIYSIFRAKNKKTYTKRAMQYRPKKSNATYIKGIYWFSSLTFSPYIFNFISDMLLMVDTTWNSLNHQGFVYDNGIFYKFYTYFSVNIVFAIINGWILVHLYKKRGYSNNRGNCSRRSIYAMTMLGFNMLNFIPWALVNYIKTNNNIQIIFGDFNE